ncbi:MAG: hypothetical protein IPJ73_16535, partial [Zoogloea sp.]|nr:hypothetical protein [Zoogloea sp.]
MSAGGLLVNQVVTVRTSPVNQAPSVAGTVTVFEGEQDVSLTANTNLVPPVSTPRGAISGSDPDDTVFSYRITSLPTHGTLKYDGVAVTSASAGSPFIVADLSKLTYSHDGSEPTGTPDSFNMRITDSGGGTGVPLSQDTTIQIGVIGNNNDPVLTTDVTQTLTGTSTSLTVTPAMLQVTDTDSPDSSLTYTLTAVPSLTRLFTLTAPGWSSAQASPGRHRRTTGPTSPLRHAPHRQHQLHGQDGDRGIFIQPPRWQASTCPAPTPSPSTPSASTCRALAPGPTRSRPTPRSMSAPAPAKQCSGAAAKGRRSHSTTPSSPPPTPDTVPAQLVYRVLSLPTSGSIRLNGAALAYFDSFTPGRRGCWP